MSTAKPSNDPLELNVTDLLALSDKDRHMLELYYDSLVDVVDTPTLKRRIVSYIHLRNLRNEGVYMASLNRRYGRVARKYETSITALTLELMADDHIQWIERTDYNNKAAVSTAFLTWAETCYVGDFKGHLIHNAK